MSFKTIIKSNTQIVLLNPLPEILENRLIRKRLSTHHSRRKRFRQQDVSEEKIHPSDVTAATVTSDQIKTFRLLLVLFIDSVNVNM